MQRPSLETVNYWKTILELGLLLLAIPYVLSQLLRDPAGATRSAGKHHL